MATLCGEADIPSTTSKTIYKVILKTSATPQRNCFQGILDITWPAKPWIQRGLVDHLLCALPALKTQTHFLNPMWLERAKLHAISGNKPWATLSLIYSCLSKLLRLQSYRSFPFKSDIIVTEYFLWALKVCSWSRKCVTATQSTIYGWILNISKQCRHPTCKYNWSISLRHSADGLLRTFALKHLQYSTPASSKSHQVHLQGLPLYQTHWCYIHERMHQAAQQSLF